MGREGYQTMSYQVFVYGTLRRHEKYHSILESAPLLSSQCWTHGKLYDTGYGYPGMKEDKKQRVYGELYRVGDAQLKQLDRLEGCYGSAKDNEYDRVKQTIITDSGQTGAYVYIYKRKVHPRQEVPFGDWKCAQHLDKEEYLYFAYGSCMDKERFELAGVDHLFENMVGRGVLDGFSLRFTRNYPDGARADIVEIGGRVEGKVYRINQEALWYLFKREGVHSKSYRPAFIDIQLNEKKVKNVLTFVVIDKEQEAAPPEWYAREIVRGGKGTLSPIYIKEVAGYLQDQFQIDVTKP
jgi:gamma-glutamylcyclotransferase (GGCT)/AIG2-like uncharacterized protein YtfP